MMMGRRHDTDTERAMVAAEWAGLKNGANQHVKEGSPIGGPSATATRNEAS
jgi:hypothetical protein